MTKSSFLGSVRTFFISALLCLPFFSNATHILAGEITYRVLSYLTYEATAVIYTDANSPIETDTITLRWGDGTKEIVNGQGQVLPNNILKTVYVSNPHTFPGPSPFYIISVLHYNRINDIVNVNNNLSDIFPLYLEDTLRIFNPIFAGVNNSPVLLSLPIDYANVNDTFYHNPIAFDPDGDSLSFQLVEPLQNRGTPVASYRYPDEVGAGPLNQFTINARTGEIIWATPKMPGIYNIAILVTEYRGGLKMGTLLRDMQIRVRNYVNDPPQIVEFADTCVVAGALVTKTVTARDADAGQIVTLSAQGGPFQISRSPAVFASTSGNPVSQTFSWQTTCDHIRPQFYQVVFRAQDSYGIPLVDLKTWLIKIVAPAPENLSAQAAGNQILLSWNQPYACETMTNFTGFSVWRRESSNPFPVDSCEVGLAGKGYVKIAQNILGYSYTDDAAGRGKQYCYRVLAEFAQRTQAGLYYNKVESLPSNETCAELKRNVPLLKNVSVTTTDAASGKIFVAWYRPKTDAANLDTTQLIGPYSYQLYRSVGFSSAAFTLVATFTNQYLGNLIDTTFTDTLLNTVNNAYSYKVKFYSNGNLLIGASDSASSVFLGITPASNKLELTWQENVPWQNQSYVVYRKNGTVFDSIATGSTQTFTDEGLTNNTEYCYVVKSLGEYSSLTMNDILENLSQQVCGTPIDLEPPCAPMLEVLSPCAGESQMDICSKEEAPSNKLDWTDSIAAECDDNNVSYNIYFAVNAQNPFVKIGTTSEIIYRHDDENTLAGCYAVTAVDNAGNESVFSNVVCVENCPCYILPNVFTPNNDSKNDYYTPIMPYRFVERVDIKIYNRWGSLVFETTNPDIRWDGKDINNGKEVKEGVYYYVCEVYQPKVLENSKQANMLSGFIHLIRGGESSAN